MYQINQISKFFSNRLDLSYFEDICLNDAVLMCTLSYGVNCINYLEYQYKFFNKYFKNDFYYVVFDNNSDLDIANDCLDFCSKHNIIYFKLPDAPLFSKGNADISHALGYNFIFRNFLYKLNCKYVGVLEQDTFLFNDIDMIDILLSTPIYSIIRGDCSSIPSARFLRPIILFFDIHFFRNFGFDFFPNFRIKANLTTGISTYWSVMKYFPEGIGDFEENKVKSGQLNCITSNDFESSWIHLSGSGNLERDVFALSHSEDYKLALSNLLQE